MDTARNIRGRGPSDCTVWSASDALDGAPESSAAPLLQAADPGQLRLHGPVSSHGLSWVRFSDEMDLSIWKNFENAVCLDPRDRIYGIRALLNREQQAICGTPEHIISHEKLYLRVVQRYIGAYPDGLTILRHCELPHLI